MCKIIIAGGGWAGCAAAVRAAKLGLRTVLVEKTDLLLGLGNVGGIMRNNGRFTAAEENIAMGASELFEITDRLSTHKNVDFPGHKHASFYDTSMVEPEVRRLLKDLGVELRFMCRAVDVVMAGDVAATKDAVTAADVAATKDAIMAGDVTATKDAVTAADGERNAAQYGTEMKCGDEPGAERRIKALKLMTANGGHYIEDIQDGDVFVETTGSTGPMGNCARHGSGCAMCILRCPAFGPRVSLTEKAGACDMTGERAGGVPGAYSGSCKLDKRTLSPKLQKKLKKDGFAVVPLPEELINRGKLSQKVCQQYALPEFAENIILIDTGSAKLMTPFFNLEQLRSVEGFENVRFEDPYAGGKANSVRYMAVGERDDLMRAKGFENLFLGGEKAGFFVGHTEAITTGSLAGYNAAMMALGGRMLRLPDALATGDLLKFAQKALHGGDAFRRRFTFAGGEYFKRMEERELYTTDTGIIKKRVKDAGLDNIYNRVFL